MSGAPCDDVLLALSIALAVIAYIHWRHGYGGYGRRSTAIAVTIAVAVAMTIAVVASAHCRHGYNRYTTTTAMTVATCIYRYSGYSGYGGYNRYNTTVAMTVPVITITIAIAIAIVACACRCSRCSGHRRSGRWGRNRCRYLYRRRNNSWHGHNRHFATVAIISPIAVAIAIAVIARAHRRHGYGGHSGYYRGNAHGYNRCDRRTRCGRGSVYSRNHGYGGGDTPVTVVDRAYR